MTAASTTEGPLAAVTEGVDVLEEIEVVVVATKVEAIKVVVVEATKEGAKVEATKVVEVEATKVVVVAEVVDSRDLAMLSKEVNVLVETVADSPTRQVVVGVVAMVMIVKEVDSVIEIDNNNNQEIIDSRKLCVLVIGGVVYVILSNFRLEIHVRHVMLRRPLMLLPW